MNWIERFKRKPQEKDVIELTKATVARLARTNPARSDYYFDKLHGYLSFAVECGLRGEEILLSCFDLADALDPYYRALDWRVKTDFWFQETGKYKDIAREPRSITMQLYPQYFAAILDGRKKYEGRAFDPFSDKIYADIRQGDRIIFNINKEVNGWFKECVTLNLEPGMLMECLVGRVLFAPTVHGVYQFNVNLGEEFQPVVTGTSEILQLQRAAIYYSFPDYARKIRDYGFLGIELVNPNRFQ